MESKSQVLDGVIDLHVHHGPEPDRDRSVNSLEAAEQAARCGMKAIVLKNVNYGTAPLASMVQQLVPNIKVFGSICLEEATGGINPAAVRAAARLGAKIVWMPTFSSRQDHINSGLAGGIKIIDRQGQLHNSVEEILQIISQYDLALATGHISRDEIFVLVEEAKKVGIKRIIATHVSTVQFGANLSVIDQSALAKMGVYMEHCFLCTLPNYDQIPLKSIVEQIQEVGSEHCVISSDLGQIQNPFPVEGMKRFIESLRKLGLSEADINLLVKINPRTILGI